MNKFYKKTLLKIFRRKEFKYEYGLPAFLQTDLDNYKAGLKGKHSAPIDCLWCELYGSMDSARVDKTITAEHAEYIRKKYLDNIHL